MEISFIKPKESKGSCKLTVHKTGKLGFSNAAVKLMNIGEENGQCMIGRDTNESGNNILYLQLSSEKNDYTYKISKAGSYYYIKANELLKEIGVDYEDEDVTTIYDVSLVPGEEKKLYQLKKRVVNKRKKSSS